MQTVSYIAEGQTSFVSDQVILRGVLIKKFINANQYY